MISKQISGYKGNVEKWKNFLSEWQDHTSTLTGCPKFDFSNHNGKDDVDYLNREFKNLPKSYLDFIEAGGSHILSIADWQEKITGYPSFFEKERVDYFKEFRKKYDEYNQDDYAYEIEINADYFDYSGSNLEYDLDDLKRTLLIGEEGPEQAYGVFLLNPTHVTSDKEWEGWFWAPNITGGGPRRYPSFAHLVAQKYTIDLVLMKKSDDPILYWNKEWEHSELNNIIEKLVL